MCTSSTQPRTPRWTLPRRLPLAAATCLLVAACTSGPPPEPAATPDPYSGLVERAHQAYDQGAALYDKGQYREALNAFERSKTFNPVADPRTDQMIAQSRLALTPTPSPIPPTLTLAPTMAPVGPNPLTPAPDAGVLAFGDVFLAVVPSQDSMPPATREFSYQDQVGLYIGALGQRLRVPFTLRIFDLDSRSLVAEARSEGDGTPTAGTPSPTRSFNPQVGTPTLGPGTTPLATATPDAGRYPVVRFFDKFVWYHNGGERPGHYRAELYAGDSLTNVLDYVVGTVRAVTPEATAPPETATPVAEPTEPIAVERIAPVVTLAAAPPAPTTRQSPPAPTTEPPPPTATLVPTATATPATAIDALTGGLPAGLDVDGATGRAYIADGSGVVWTADQQRPTLDRPFNVGCPRAVACPALSQWLPTGLAVDQTTGLLYVAARSKSESAIVVLDGPTGRRVAEIPLAVPPTDVRLDAELGLLYVVLPARQALATVDIRAGRVVRVTNGLREVTGMALDADRHQLYLTELTGLLSTVDGASGQITGRLGLGAAGVSGVATARGLVYAINTAGRTLLVVNPGSGEMASYGVGDQPDAVAAGEQSGSVYVLSSKPNAIMRLDPTDGSEVGRVLLSDRGGRSGVQPNRGDVGSQRSHISINAQDETLYVTFPEAGTLSIVPPDLFQPLSREIPYLDTETQSPERSPEWSN